MVIFRFCKSMLMILSRTRSSSSFDLLGGGIVVAVPVEGCDCGCDRGCEWVEFVEEDCLLKGGGLFGAGGLLVGREGAVVAIVSINCLCCLFELFVLFVCFVFVLVWVVCVCFVFVCVVCFVVLFLFVCVVCLFVCLFVCVAWFVN